MANVLLLIRKLIGLTPIQLTQRVQIHVELKDGRVVRSVPVSIRCDSEENDFIYILCAEI
jgi:hypothetical protein